MSSPSPRPPALRYRPARPTDVETLAELATIAYRVSSLEKRREFYTDHPRFTIRDVRVGELDGQIVASLVLYTFTAFVRPTLPGRGEQVYRQMRYSGILGEGQMIALRHLRLRSELRCAYVSL